MGEVAGRNDVKQCTHVWNSQWNFKFKKWTFWKLLGKEFQLDLFSDSWLFLALWMTGGNFLF